MKTLLAYFIVFILALGSGASIGYYFGVKATEQEVDEYLAGLLYREVYSDINEMITLSRLIDDNEIDQAQELIKRRMAGNKIVLETCYVEQCTYRPRHTRLIDKALKKIMEYENN